MSKESWLKKYYPIDARVAAHKGVIAAIKHGQLKYSGCKPKVLKKHELYLLPGDSPMLLVGELCIIGGSTLEEVMTFGRMTCALCQKFNCQGQESGPRQCPLDAIDACCVNFPSPYSHFIETGDPTKMLAAFKEALVWAKENYGQEEV